MGKYIFLGGALFSVGILFGCDEVSSDKIDDVSSGFVYEYEASEEKSEVRESLQNDSYNSHNKDLGKTSASSADADKSECHPSYSGCLKIGAGDYDCAGGSGNGPNYTGRVQVLGYDEFGLDRDKDGIGCE